MARTYNKSKNVKTAPAKSAPAAEEKTAVVKPAPPKAAPAKAVIAAPDKEVVKQIVYQPSAQILTRDVDASETFAIGDDMPIYYL